MNVQAFLDNYVNATFTPTVSSFSLMKCKFELGFEGVVKDKNIREFFLIGDDPKADRDKAQEWVETNGGKSTVSNPYPAVRTTKYKGTSFTHSTKEWDGDKSFVITGYKGPDPKDNYSPWIYFPNYELLMSSLVEFPSKWGYNVEPKLGKEGFGKDVWVLFQRKPDLSFDRDDESTWTKYNSYTSGEGEEEKTGPQYYDYVAEVFGSKDEAVKWMQANGHELGGDMVDGKEETIGVEMPDSFLSEEAWADDAESSWKEIKNDLVKDLTPIASMAKPAQVKALNNVAETWSISVETLKAVLTQLTPF